ncbi:MAG TPA: cytochrome C551 [Clostridiaceae bacterium]|nr:cytochrome C551 [Clostridiaceae bacterium]
MSDKTLLCKDCGSEFVFTEGEQQFYQEKGFQNEPQRCPDCRRARKAQKRNGGGFNSGNRHFSNRW